MLYNITLASAIKPHEPATGTRMSPPSWSSPHPTPRLCCHGAHRCHGPPHLCCQGPRVAPVLCHGSSLAVYAWPCTYISAALSVHPALSSSTSASSVSLSSTFASLFLPFKLYIHYFSLIAVQLFFPLKQITPKCMALWTLTYNFKQTT